MSLRETILQAQDIKTEQVKVPEWNATVNVRGLTAGERDDFEASWFVMDASGEMVRSIANLRARLCVRSVVDENGNRLFTDADTEALGQKSGRAMDRIYEVASRLSGLSKKDVDELVKN